MNLLVLVIAAFFLGCLAAVPAGPVQIEVVRRSLNGHLKPSLMVVLGAFFVDIFYGAIAFFGIAPFLEDKRVMAVFWLVGGLILIVLGAIVIRHSLKPRETAHNAQHLKKKRWALLGGVSLSVTNPMMILWWLSGAKIFRDIGLIQNFNTEVAIWFLGAGSLGLASYLTALSLFLFWAKRFITAETLKKINFVFGAVLLLTAGYLVFTSLLTLLKPA